MQCSLKVLYSKCISTDSLFGEAKGSCCVQKCALCKATVGLCAMNTTKGARQKRKVSVSTRIGAYYRVWEETEMFVCTWLCVWRRGRKVYEAHAPIRQLDQQPDPFCHSHTAVDVDRRLFPYSKDQLRSVWSNFLASLSLRSFQLLCYQTHPPFFLLLSLLAVLPFVHSTRLSFLFCFFLFFGQTVMKCGILWQQALLVHTCVCVNACECVVFRAGQCKQQSDPY